MQNLVPKKRGNTWKTEEVENMKISAEHHTVVKKQGSRGSVAERDLYQKMMENLWKKRLKINEKSMQNRCAKKWCKNDEKWANMEPKWEPKSIKNQKRSRKNEVQKSMSFWNRFCREARGPQAPKTTYYQQDFLRKNNKKENYLQETYLKTN